MNNLYVKGGSQDWCLQVGKCPRICHGNMLDRQQKSDVLMQLVHASRTAIDLR